MPTLRTAEARGVRTLTEAKALSALANPFRARMIDALKVDGPSTASSLAARTGQAVGSASHHLKVLSEAGLVVEAPELARDRRERWWRLATRGTQWSAFDLLDDPAALSAAREAEALQLRRQIERLQEWMSNAETSPEWLAVAFATQHWLRVTPEELNELAEELNEVLSKWSMRELPDDGKEREPALAFARGFPSQP
ncbi:MAG: putative ArsR family transcriptional regulator [Marmoricola sp.]|nr:putative ArsR family transcriptional regulator [Marmoricola sp.]